MPRATKKVKGLEIPAPIPAENILPFNSANNPDRWRPVDAAFLERLPADLVGEYQLDKRLFTQHGRIWLAGRLLGTSDVERILGTCCWQDDLGLHLSFFGKYPGLGTWLRWEGLSRIRHLSFNGGFLAAKGLELLLSTARLGNVETLDLSVCDIGQKGLQLLNASDEMPRLSELYLASNPDFDRTIYNEKAVAALLSDTPASPMGESLKGLKVLSLQFWELVKAMDILEQSPLVQGLEKLWITDKYYRDYEHHSNAEAVPASLRSRCVVGWEQAPLN